MKALIKREAKAGIWLEEIPVPQMQENEVLIKIHKTAICGTDLHIYRWDTWAQNHIQVPLTIGHEFVGEIVNCGKNVRGFKVGDRVSGEGHIACGHCRPCRTGRANICYRNETVGVSRPGCFAEYLVLPACNAYPVPTSIPDEVAAILDPLGNATHTALSHDVIGEDVVITGAGPVGILAALVSRHVGSRYVVVSDINEYRLALARQMGITVAINPQQQNFPAVMKSLGMREGFDVGLEMSGNIQAFQSMLASMNHGGKIALLGFLPEQTAIDWPAVIMKGLLIKGIYGREMFDTWYKTISMLQSGLKVEQIVTHRFGFNDYQLAFETVASGQCGKVILEW